MSGGKCRGLKSRVHCYICAPSPLLLPRGVFFIPNSLFFLALKPLRLAKETQPPSFGKESRGSLAADKEGIYYHNCSQKMGQCLLGWHICRRKLARKVLNFKTKRCTEDAKNDPKVPPPQQIKALFSCLANFTALVHSFAPAISKHNKIETYFHSKKSAGMAKLSSEASKYRQKLCL